MQTDNLFYESAEEALKECVRALGGNKKVGQILWPEKSVDVAARYLSDSLNEARAEKLDINQVKLIFTMARDADCVSPFKWFCGEIGFEATPINRQAQSDRAVEVIQEAAKTLQQAMDSFSRLNNIGGINDK